MDKRRPKATCTDTLSTYTTLYLSRLAILAVCTLEWRSSLADVIVETHDSIVGRLYRASERLCNTRIADEKAAVRDTLKSFAEIGGALLGAQDDGTAMDGIIATGTGWERVR